MPEDIPLSEIASGRPQNTLGAQPEPFSLESITAPPASRAETDPWSTTTELESPTGADLGALTSQVHAEASTNPSLAAGAMNAQDDEPLTDDSARALMNTLQPSMDMDSHAIAKVEQRLNAYMEDKREREKFDKDEEMKRIFDPKDPSGRRELGRRPDVKAMLDMYPDQDQKNLALDEVAVDAFLEVQAGRPLSEQEKEVHRHIWGQQQTGDPTTSYTTAKGLISKYYDKREQTKLFMRELDSLARKDYIEGAVLNQPPDSMKTLKHLESAYPDLVNQDNQSAVYSLYQQAQRRAHGVVERNRPAALAIFAAGQKAAAGIPVEQADIDAIQDTVRGMKPVDRMAIFSAVADAVTVGVVDKPFVQEVLSNIGKAIGRGTAGRVHDGRLMVDDAELDAEIKGLRDGTAKVDQGGDIWTQAEIKANRFELAGLRKMTEEERAALLKQREDLYEDNQIQREWKHVYETQIDPYKSALPDDFQKTGLGKFMKGLEMGAYQFGEQFPTMAMTAIPFVGMGLTTAAFGASYYNQMKMKDPDMDTDAAIGISMAAATIESLFEKFQWNSFTGKGFAQKAFLTNLRTNGPMVFLREFGKVTVEQNLEEAIQDLSTTAIMTIAANVRPDMRDVDFATEVKQLFAERIDVAAMLFIPSLVGGGMATWRHIKDPDREYLNERAMDRAGISRAWQAKIFAETDRDLRDVVYREAFAARTQADIKKGMGMIVEDIAQEKAAFEQTTVPKATLESTTNDKGERITNIISPTGQVLAKGLNHDVALAKVQEINQQLAAEFLAQGATQLEAETAARATAEGEAELEMLDEEGKETAATSPASSIDFEAPTAAAPDAAVARLNAGIQKRFKGVTIREVTPSETQATATGSTIMNTVNALQAFTGRRVRFAEDVTGKELPFRGVVDPSDPNTIWIDARGTRSTLAIFGHEFTHSLKKSNPTLYAEFEAAIKPFLPAIEAERAKLAGVGYKEQELTDEYLANVMGDAFAHKELLAKLAQNNPSLFTKLIDALKKWFDEFKAFTDSTFGTEAGIDIEKVHEQIAKLLEKTKTTPVEVEPTLAEEEELAYARITKWAKEWLAKQGLPLEMEEQVTTRAKEIAKQDRRGVPNTQDVQQALSEIRPEDLLLSLKEDPEANKHRMEIERGQREVAAIGHYSDEEQAKVKGWVKEQLDAMKNVPKHGAKRTVIENEMLRQVEENIRKKRRENPDKVEPKTETTTGVTSPWASVKISGVETVFTPKTGKQKKDKIKAFAKWKNIPFSFGNIPAGQTFDQYTQGLAEKMVQEFVDRLAKGGKNAKVILDQIGWYRNMIINLRKEYGGFSDMFADFLGGFSPATGVPENWKNAVGFLEAVSNGKYDTLFEELRAWVDSGKTIKQWRDAKKPIPLKENEITLFGSNTNNGLAAVLEMWREVKYGDPPKARNFTKNLIGLSLHATIDRWAARMLQRLAGHERIPIGMAETGVSGFHVTPAKYLETFGRPDVSGQELPPTGEFGVGQDVFAKAAAMMIAHDPVLFAGLLPSDMQAMNWFVEKELWAENNWTYESAEGGSFEEMNRLQNVQRFVIGLTQAREGIPGKKDLVPTTKQNVKFGEKLRARLVGQMKTKNQFLAVRAKDSVGMFEGKPERSLDTELLTGPNIEPMDIVNIAAEEAGKAFQKSTFIARAMKDNEDDNPNERPGIEVYFERQVTVADVQPVMDFLVSKGIDGFTAIVDARAKPNPKRGATGPDQVWGVRMMWIPEYAVEGHELAEDWAKQGEMVEDVLLEAYPEIEKLQGVAHAVVMTYDTLVLKTGIDYDTRGLIRTSIGQSLAEAWRGRFFSASTPRTTGQPAPLQAADAGEAGGADVSHRGEGRGEPGEDQRDAAGDVGDEPQYALAPAYKPKKTVTAYKLFKLGKDGNLYPLFIGRNTPTPAGQWIVAQFIPTKGFAKRPGWHAGSLPYAGHLRSTTTGQKALDRVWAEVEMPADRNWQAVADAQPKKDIRDRIPANGHYLFKTSKMQGGAWMIGGALKIRKILSNSDVARILTDAGHGDQVEAETNGELSYSLRAGKFAQAQAEGPLDRPASIQALFEKIHGQPQRKAELFARAYRAWNVVSQRHEAEIAGYQPPEVPNLDEAITENEAQEELNRQNLDLEEQAEIDASVQAASDEFDGPIADARDEVTRKALEREKRLYISRRRKGIEAVYAERAKALAQKHTVERQAIRQKVAEAQMASTAEGSAELKRMRRMQTFAELNAILNAMPSEIRGRLPPTPSLEGLTDEALMDFLAQRMKQLGRELEFNLKKGFVESIEDLLKSAKPKRTPGGVLKGKVGDMEHVIKAIQGMTEMSNDQVALEISNIETQLTGGTMTPEQDAAALERQQLLTLFGDLSHRDAATLETAHATLQAIIQQGRSQWYHLEKARLTKQREQSDALVTALGQADPEQIAAMRRNEGFLAGVSGFVNSHHSFFEFLRQQLPGLPFVAEWANRSRIANAASEDFARKAGERFTQTIRTAIGSNSVLRTGTAVEELQKATIRGRTAVLMTKLEAIQYILSWEQSDVQEKMVANGWLQGHIDNLVTATSDPVSQAVKAFLKQEYEASWKVLNPTYKAMYGMDMPKIPNYAPSRYHYTGQEQDINVFGGPTATSGITPSFVHARVNHSAPLRQMDAMHVYMQHMTQVASFTNFAELLREMRGTLNNGNVKMSLEKSLGSANYKNLNMWIDSLQRNGANKAGETLAIEKMVGYMTKVKAVSAMAFNVKTAVMQTDSALRWMAEIPFRHWAKAFIDPNFPSLIHKVWHSDTVQRRVREGMTPDMQYLMQQGNLTPSKLLWLARAGFTHIRYLDAAFTSFSSAAVYNYHYKTLVEAGTAPADAEAMALDKMDAAVQRFSQPTMITAKGLISVNGNQIFKMIAMFMSDPMLKTSIMANAVQDIAKGKDAGMGYQRIAAVMVWAMVSQVLANLYRDWASDDEDEEIWTWQGFVRAGALAPFQGFFLVGSIAESTIAMFTGAPLPVKNPDIFAEYGERAKRSVKNIDDALNFNDYAKMVKEWDNILKTLSVIPYVAPAAAMGNIIKPVAGAVANIQKEE